MESSMNDMEVGVTGAGKTITNIQQRDYLDDAERLLGVVVGAIDAPTPVLVSRPEEHEQLLTEAGGDRGRKEEKYTGGGKELVMCMAPPRADNADATEPLTSTQNIGTGPRYWVAAGAASWPSMREAMEAVGSWEVLGLLVTPQVVCTAAILVGESLAVSWVVGGGLAIVVCVLTGLCLNECREYGCGDSDTQRYALIALLSLLGLAAHGTLMLTVAGWASVISCTGLAGMGCVGGFVVLMWKRCKEEEWDSEWTIIFALALWLAALTVVPAVLFTWADFATTSHATSTLGACGVFVFVTALWMLGWAFLWYRGEKLEPIAGNQHLATVPPITLQRLKLFTVLSECYNYCGFSYFPALPWKAMVVPPEVPHPQIVMLAGFFHFDDVDTHFWIFLGAAVTVVLSFVFLGLTVYFDKPKLQDLVVQILFDLVCFPLIKQLSGVFSCTSANVWIERKDKLSGTIEAARFCDTGTVSMDMQCMDNDPSVQCWGGQHRSYIVAVLVLLVPYYVVALELQRLAQARQTVVKIDGGWLVVTMQSKFLLAVIASSFGECFPIVMVASVEAVVLSQLIMMCCGVDFSNVHSLNAVRMAGVLAATFNGMYATFVLWHFRDDPAARPPCTMTAPNNGIDGSSSSLQSTTSLELVNDYSTFFGLIGVNVGAIAYGIWWWWQRRSSWLAHTASKFASLNSSNTDASAREVDYPIVESRLRAVDDLITSRPEVSADARSQPGFLFELYTREESDGDDRPQELESATLDLVLGCASLAAPHGVSLLGIDSTTKSGQLVLKHFQQARYWILGLPCITIRVEKVRCFRARWARKHPARVACVQLVAVGNTDIQLLLDALQNSSLTSLSLVGAGIGVEGVAAIATVIPTMASVVTINCLANNFGEDGLSTLLAAIKGTSVRSLCGLTEGQTVADFSGQNLGPIDCRIMAAEFSFQGFITSIASLKLDSNGIFGELYSDGAVKEADKFVAEVQPFLDALKTSSLTSLSLRSTGMGVKGIIAATDAIRAMPSLTSCCLLHNPLGEGVNEIIKVFEQTPRLCTLCGFEEGIEKIDWSNSGKGVVDVALLSADLAARRATASLTSLRCGSNPIKDEGMAVLLDAVKGIGLIEFDISKTEIGPPTAKKLAEVLSDATPFTTSIASLTLDSNGIFGEFDQYGCVKEADKFVAEIQPLLDALKTSSITSLSLCGTGMGVKGVAAVGDAIRAMPSIAHIVLDECAITGTTFGTGYKEHQGGDHEKIEQLDADCTGFETLCEALGASQVASISLKKCYLGPQAMSLLAAATPKMASIKVINLSKCPLTGATKNYRGEWENIDSDMTGFIAFCGVLGKLHEINLSDCGLGPTSAAELGKAVSSADTSLTSLCCGSNPIKDEGMAVLLDAVKDVALIEFDIAKTEIGPPTAKKLAEVLSDATPFTASVVSLTLDDNGIFGEIWSNMEYNGGSDPDSLVEQCDPILQAIKVSQLTYISLRHTGIGPLTMQKMATSLPASLTKVVITDNKISESDVATLRAAAPNRCEVVC